MEMKCDGDIGKKMEMRRKMERWRGRRLRYALQRQNAENLKENIPRKGIPGPQSQFPHSCVCARIIYLHDGSAFSAGGNMWTDPANI
jgi:hypothetical protein